MRILVLDGVKEAGVAALQRPGWQVDIVPQPWMEAELIAHIGSYNALIVRSTTKVTAPVIEAAHSLKIIGRAGVGVDNIDLEAATRRGIVVVNAPDGNTIAAAEHSLALMLALARNIPQGDASLKQGHWERKHLIGVELRQKTLGILGLGRIGSAVVRRAQAFDMLCLGYDPYISTEQASRLGVELVSLKTLLERSDFITIHMPLTGDTRHLLDAEALALMKPGVRIINAARGGIVDEAALAEAVKAGKVAGAAVDVFEEEPVVSSPLLDCPNVVLTPHLGASTAEAQLHVAVDVAEAIANFLDGGLPNNAVNMTTLALEVMEKLAPYIQLAEKLGAFLAQMAGGISRLRVTYSGALVDWKTGPITTSILKGMLERIVDDYVNLVNADYLARRRGIRVETVHRGNGDDYHNRIAVEAETSEGLITAAGSVFQPDSPRIVEINGYRVDAIPTGHMLVAPHQDRPGIIGKVGTILGQASINIATMQVGRKKQGGPAVMVLGTDAALPSDVLQAICQIDGIYGARQVVFAG
ncbi:MAG: phosphoglycerate dehydrogenase [Firmicutes bacterium]|nr:phosphoglycerate dehydrogenase [Bacillota bacterium]